MKHITSIGLMLAACCFAITPRLGPDTGGPAGGGGAPSEEEDNLDYEAEATRLGISLPVYPGTPAGIAQARTELKRLVTAELAKRGEPFGGPSSASLSFDEQLEVLMESLETEDESVQKDKLLEITEAEGTPGVDEGNTVQEIARAIITHRNDSGK